MEVVVAFSWTGVEVDAVSAEDEYVGIGFGAVETEDGAAFAVNKLLQLVKF
ncbi:hypothetical protein CYANOKiyG1_72860 [Okeania sp. KiyG1]|nr:hypothetical protein CYANOKiyG1_72860 [Okeania sp. KiyG1]